MKFRFRFAILSGKADRIQDEFIRIGLSELDRAEENGAADMAARIEKTLRLAETQKDAAWWLNNGRGRDFRTEYKALKNKEVA